MRSAHRQYGDYSPHRTEHSSYSSFDYRHAYGRNPFATPASKLQSAISPLYDRVNQLAKRSGSFVAQPSDSAVTQYLSRVLQGERNVVDEYVRRAASAGITRGGANVVGGAPLESSLHHQAMSTLARDYSNRFGEAMNYGKYVKNAQYDQLGDSIKNLENLLGLQQSYLSSKANWQNRVASSMHGDWRDDVDWGRQTSDRRLGRGTQAPQWGAGASLPGLPSSAARSALRTSDPKAELELEGVRQEMEMQRRRNMWEEEDRQRAVDARNAQQSNWSRLRSLPSGLNETTNLQGANLLSKLPGSSTRKKTSSR
jgi:hypothetical protein